ncbi:phenylacetate--CoA ligase family protein [Paradesulfitobacterium ferrireducens]|uniref:phenylacetate--CoA ligase family protein n=1 Tax=Paradesulfitobacterium ferrireducens TaxID=2816476 RepID=UPI001A8D6D4B|nr:phenylacetate--CoA ligase [Paradesulfitobacterium ferrireducens]
MAVELAHFYGNDLADMQLSKLKKTVAYVYAMSPFYRAKLDTAGVKPEDIRTLADIARLPFTTKEELRDNYPDKLMIAPERDVVRLHASSGTTGKKTVSFYTKKDINDWAQMMARCFQMAGIGPRDRVHNTTGYGLWTAGVGFQLGIEALGAMAVPIGPAPMDQQIELMVDFGTTVLASTSSYALLLAEEIQRRNLRDQIKLRVALIGSERWSDKMREQINTLLDIESFDIIGMTEVYGPGIGLDCHYHQGIHYWADHVFFEIIDPVTQQPCQPGEQGELVITTLSKEAMPVIRYRTRDITRMLPDPCKCNSPFPRIDRILGRTDDMIKFRGVNIFPGQVDDVLNKVNGVSCEYQIVMERQQGKDIMTVRVEAEEGLNPAEFEKLGAKIKQLYKNRIGVTPTVEIVNYKELPRSEKKAKRVIDRREQD